MKNPLPDNLFLCALDAQQMRSLSDTLELETGVRLAAAGGLVKFTHVQSGANVTKPGTEITIHGAWRLCAFICRHVAEPAVTRARL